MPTTRSLRVFIESVYDDSPDLSWLEQDYNDVPADEALLYRTQDAERLAAYRRNDWYMIGVRLAAEITLTSNNKVPNPSWRTSTLKLTTPGVWGVESDGDDSYLHEIAGDESDYMREDLLALGFSTDEVDEALGDVAALEVIERG
jgi:hypothetical protein